MGTGGIETLGVAEVCHIYKTVYNGVENVREYGLG